MGLEKRTLRVTRTTHHRSRYLCSVVVTSPISSSTLSFSLVSSLSLSLSLFLSVFRPKLWALRMFNLDRSVSLFEMWCTTEQERTGGRTKCMGPTVARSAGYAVSGMWWLELEIHWRIKVCEPVFVYLCERGERKREIDEGCEQCDQIGRFLKVFSDRFSFKSSLNAGWLLEFWWKTSLFKNKLPWLVFWPLLGFLGCSLLQSLVTLIVSGEICNNRWPTYLPTRSRVGESIRDTTT